MENNGNVIFEEKQYLGYNRYSNVRRIVLALFCFLAYFFRVEHDRNGELLFGMGVAIMVISALLIFVLHLHTKVTETSIILDGLWTSKRIKIDLSSIVSVKSVPSKNFLLSRPVYNLHRNGVIRFYTRGKEGVELTDRDGLKYVIGSQTSGQLADLLREKVLNNSNLPEGKSHSSK